jgi:hypothetical protein
MEFKYSLIYECKSIEEKNDVINKLKDLQYNTSSLRSLLDTELFVKTYIDGTFSSFTNLPFGRLVSSKELFLAAAAQRNSKKFYVGEYVVIRNTALGVKKGDIGKINSRLDDDGTCRYENYNYLVSVKGIVSISKYSPYVLFNYTILDRATIDDLITYFEKEEKEEKEIKEIKEIMIKTAVKGSLSLLKAFAEELETLGYKAHNSSELYNKTAHLLIYEDNKYAYSYYDGINRTAYNLPEEWNEALEIVKESFKPKFKPNTWYKYLDDPECILFSKNNEDVQETFGFWNSNWGDDWRYDWCLENPSQYTEATDKEVLDLFKKELTERGFKEGVKFNSTVGGLIYTFTNEKDVYFRRYIDGNFAILQGVNLLYYDGKWAEVIDEAIIVCGHTVTYSLNTVIIGCTKIDSSVFTNLATLYYNLLNSDVCSKNIELSGIQYGDYTIPFDTILKIADYFKNK